MSRVNPQALTVKKCHINLRAIFNTYGAMGSLTFKNPELNCVGTVATEEEKEREEEEDHDDDNDDGDDDDENK
jgi:hypothetical protein